MFIYIRLKDAQKPMLYVRMARFGGRQEDVLSLQKFVLLAAIVRVFREIARRSIAFGWP
jgi:hypothetical protein